MAAVGGDIFSRQGSISSWFKFRTCWQHFWVICSFFFFWLAWPARNAHLTFFGHDVASCLSHHFRKQLSLHCPLCEAVLICIHPSRPTHRPRGPLSCNVFARSPLPTHTWFKWSAIQMVVRLGWCVGGGKHRKTCRKAAPSRTKLEHVRGSTEHEFWANPHLSAHAASSWLFKETNEITQNENSQTCAKK